MKTTQWINRDNHQVNDNDPMWQIADNQFSWDAIEQLQSVVTHNSRRIRKALKRQRRDVAKLQGRGAPGDKQPEDTPSLGARWLIDGLRAERDEALALLREGHIAVNAWKSPEGWRDVNPNASDDVHNQAYRIADWLEAVEKSELWG